MRTRTALAVFAALAASLASPSAGANRHTCGGSFVGSASCSFTFTGDGREDGIEIEGASTGVEFWTPCSGTCAPSVSVDRGIEIVVYDPVGKELLRCSQVLVMRAECDAEREITGYPIGVHFLCSAEAVYASAQGRGTVSEFICNSIE